MKYKQFGKYLVSYLALTVLFGFWQVLSVSADTFLDQTYGTGGKVTTSFGHDAAATQVVLQSDGKAVVAGYASSGSNNDWVIARYNTDGSLDNNFGTNGKAIQDLGNNDF